MRATRKRNSGFTLVELILVLVIIVIMLGIVAPRLMGLADAQQSVNFAQRIENFTRFAHGEAMVDGSVYHLNIDNTKHQFWLTIETNIGDQVKQSDVTTSDFGLVNSIPDGIRLQFTPASMQGIQDQSQVSLSNGAQQTDGAHFYPDGRVQAGVFWITDMQHPGHDIWLVCPTMTDTYRIQQVPPK